MSTNSQDQEIDLGQVFKKIKDFFNTVLDRFFDFLLFIKRNIIVLIVLLILGVGLGFYLDKTTKKYDHNIIVTPNFGSVDYLYSKIDLLSSKKKEDDTLFLSSIGIKDCKSFSKIEIEPVIDVYKFIENKPENFDLIKLMAEDGDLEKIIKSDVTSKNYSFHLIKIGTKDKTDYNNIIKPILNFLNQSDYFDAIKKQNLLNLKEKMIANDSTVAKINTLLNDFSKTSSSNQKSDKLVYYNENNQLNDIIKTKEDLVKEQGINRINLINSDKTIKDVSTTINIKNTKGLNTRKKIIVPLLFLFLFFLLSILKRFYQVQTRKRSLEA